MVDMKPTIVAKSDQLNADDLIGGPLTIRVSGVSLLAGEQPVGIHYEGDNGKPYKPCKSMRRVLVSVWGADGNAYTGRSMALYRDETVQWGGAEVGGIRISHMSGIDKPVTMSLTASRKSKKPFTVRPLAVTEATSGSGYAQLAADTMKTVGAEIKPAELHSHLRSRAVQAGHLKGEIPTKASAIVAALDTVYRTTPEWMRGEVEAWRAGKIAGTSTAPSTGKEPGDDDSDDPDVDLKGL